MTSSASAFAIEAEQALGEAEVTGERARLDLREAEVLLARLLEGSALEEPACEVRT